MRQPLWEREIAEARREAVEISRAVSGHREPVVSVEEIAADGVGARLYRPIGDEESALVWLHGGGWMLGDPECCDAIARAMANRVGCAVVSVDYRLAPEHRYPAAIDDCWVATKWARARFKHVAVGGDSSGGNLAAVVALRARDRRVELAMQLLVYPVLDYAAIESPFYSAYERRYKEFAGTKNFGALSHAGIRHIWETYVPDPSNRADPYASPLQARSLVGVAPALVITAEHDILRGEAEEYARRLASDGVAVNVINYEGQVHGFFNALSIMDDARHAVGRSADALRQYFAVAGGDPDQPRSS